VILSVRPRSTAARLFQAGDVVLKVGREHIGSLADLERALGQRQRGWLVELKRRGQVLQLQLAG